MQLESAGRVFVLTVILTFATCGSAMADKCAATTEVAPWADLISWRPSALVQQNILDRDPAIQFQHIEDALSNDLNVDSYTVTINKLPTLSGSKMTGADLIAYVRANIGSKFLDPAIATFAAYNKIQDGRSWVQNPIGALMHFHILILGPSFQDASVVTSDYDRHHWIFTTMRTPNDHRHPVSGNRWFGVSGDSEPVTFTIRGVDRPFFYGTGSFFGGFKSADELWKGFQMRLVRFVNDNQGSAVANPRTWIQCSWSKSAPVYFTPTVPWIVPQGADPNGA